MINELKNQQSSVLVNSLKGMQSVRATFSLSKNTINMLSTVANQLGVKQKSIFDHLVENRSLLEQVVDEAKKGHHSTKDRQQRTFVLSRNSLKSLERIARKNKLPRDMLVELSIRHLKPVIDSEKKRHENRKTLLKEMESFLDSGQELLDKAGCLIGKDDPFYHKLTDVLTLYKNNMEELYSIIEKGKSMEEFQ